MLLKMDNLKASSGTTQLRKRVGRGNGSGKGTYSGRGMKGQRSRSGGKSGLLRRAMKAWISKLPKYKGFKSINPNFQVVNLFDLEKSFTDNSRITKKVLVAQGLVVSSKKPVKILGEGELTKKLVFATGIQFSKSAVEKINKAKGVIEGKSE